MVSCPVCKRIAPVGEESGRVFRHRDGINNVCVMTGRRYPLNEERKAS